MADAVIELNDCEVSIIRSGNIVASSPGVAVLEQDRIVLGQAALQAAHIDPRNTFSRFWSNLNQDNFKQRTKLARHNADLAFAHLLSLHDMAGEVDRVIFAVPGSFANSQLSLLLGLAEASPFTVTGLIDSAVAAAAAAGAGRFSYLDIHLHHTVITSMEVSGTVNRTAVKAVNDVGLLDIHDRCVNHMADLFIQQSRFDPLHHAATEQALHNRLAQCLQELETEADTMVEIEFENARYQARVNRERLVEALQPLYNKISAVIDPSCATLVNRRMSVLPAFTDRLAAAKVRAEVVDERAIFDGCTGYALENKTAGEDIYFVTQLKVGSGPQVNSETPAAADRDQQPGAGATHILVDAEAHSLGPVPLYLSAQGVLQESGEGPLCTLTSNGTIATLSPVADPTLVLLNGSAVTGNTGLKPGDVIGFTGSTHEFTLIRVLA